MAHFQERRTGGERRQFKGEDRRKSSDRRDNIEGNVEFIERARFKAWMVMTDKNTKDQSNS
ncbi:MAG: hypothetical protein GKR92_11485 [Gammaproteobacteria bacterium]|nr:MAG: hypothetical protein GKR92_11485 [Gammaproteobacteria bacterium]